ncbi:MAG: signal recognition particle protein [Proteobacteria bacterium]|jgi:signal recognition particle subunit SRP54|nr:signal recognition particle protein [Pseudomonadota bacterium]
MFEQLSDRLRATMKRVRGQARLTEDNISDALREVRIALLEADVALPVAKEFIKQLKVRAIGEGVAASLSPGQQLVKLVNEELVIMMGEANDALDLAQRPPAVVMMAGLQGAGKTTTVAKLAKRLMDKEGKKVMVVSADVYRPAAIEQLKTLAESVGCQFYPSDPSQKPVDIASGALQAARDNVVDVLLVDTAGRLHVDEELMDEIQQLHKAVDPIETLFVVDSMTGQDAVNSAKAFGEKLPLTGIVLTKTDGDARGGAALSIRQVTGKPIKFLGIGEKIDGLEAFHPDRVASRILGMGDVLTLIEEAEGKIDRQKTERLAKKLRTGKGFNLDDYQEQIQQMNNMGGLGGLMEKLPGMDRIPQQMMGGMGTELNKNVAIINSMTPQEKAFPAILKGSRKRRIAMGSGTQVQDVNRLLKQFTQMQKMMKKMGKKGNMAKMMRGMGGGNMPPGMPGAGM